jgi:hypothetical protein
MPRQIPQFFPPRRYQAKSPSSVFVLRNRLKLCGLAVLVSLGAAGHAESATIKDLGSFGGTSVATAINASGWVNWHC